MDDVGWLGRLFQTFGLPAAAWAAVLAFIAHLLKLRNERLRDVNTEKSGDWDRIRAERDNARNERDRIHALWIDCEEERVALLSRAVTAEATLLGLGQAKQEAAKILSAERLVDDAKKSGPTGGGK